MIELLRQQKEEVARMNAMRNPNKADEEDDAEDSEFVFDDEEISEEEFVFDDYIKAHHLSSLFDFAKVAKANKQSMRTMPVVVQLEVLNSGSHFSEDKFNLAIAYWLLLLIFVGLTFANF
mmetsp:Transcript_24215/g.37305  ORF Transcript_24215/g.37305 Transcript_24215/m.37305 type:complete len:120 (-) Transcript_24215:830-1189(-)